MLVCLVLVLHKAAAPASVPFGGRQRLETPSQSSRAAQIVSRQMLLKEGAVTHDERDVRHVAYHS